MREGSPTYKKWVGVELSAENKRQLLIPRGFLHGFVTLTDDVESFIKQTIITMLKPTEESDGMTLK